MALGLTMAVVLAVEPALAAVQLHPVPTGAETQRFLHGTPTVTLETATGAVELTPLPFDHGHIVFGVAVYNKGAASANFGVENVDAVIGGRIMTVLPEAELERRAKSRALWTQVGIAVLAGAAAGIAAGAHTTTRAHGTVRGPGGGYRWTAATRDDSLAALGVGAAAVGGAAGIAGIHERLDYTLNELATDGVQTTTVDPQASYGGRLVLEKPEGARLPYDVVVAVHWNGADYPFTFRATENGRDRPPAYAAVPAPPAVLSTGTVPAIVPVRPAVLVAPGPAARPEPTPGAPRAVAYAIVPPAPRLTTAGYRNGRDDAIIVPMR